MMIVNSILALIAILLGGGVVWLFVQGAIDELREKRRTKG